MINIAILGFGNIGSGVADVFSENKSVISKKIGDTVNIKYILDKIDIKNHPLSERQVKDFDIILDDPDISLIVETLGGADFAYKCTKAALEKGISVVTPNKELVAAYGAELLKIASQNDARYFFEGSVGGGIPVIRPIYNCLAANKINKITAILNGTTNFILTKMANDGLDFDVALKMAQEFGFAEADPTDDIDGKDTCRKICILSSLAFGRQLPPEKVHAEGIRNITLDDIKNAEKIGCKIKLIATSYIDSSDISGSNDTNNTNDANGSDALYAITSPMLVSKSTPLYNIDDVFNGIVVTGNAIGDVMFYGRGAGKLPTASAVAADVIDALIKSTKNITWEISDGSYVADFKKCPVKYYVRAGIKSDFNSTYGLIKRTFAGRGGCACGCNSDCDIYEAYSGGELFFTVGEKSVKDEYEFGEKIMALSDAGIKIGSKIRIL